MKIKLINPGHLNAEGEPVNVHKEMSPGLTLPYLAALFPRDNEIVIIEEGLEAVVYDEPVDLVGITVMTARAPRAYFIADQFRERGVPVIMGGFHVSALPEEALAHCDAVVQGEAEGLIDRMLSDLAAGKLSGIYRRQEPADMKNLPVPRYDLLNMSNYVGHLYPVQATRGCPHQCDFCAVSAFYGRKHRKRPVADVIEDIKQAGPLMLIIDDNLTADREYALELFAAMKPLKKWWGAQFDLAAANDTELVRAASDAGCLFVYIGVETIDPENLQSSGKSVNLKVPAAEAIRNLKRHHVEPWVSMIVGFEHDDPGTAQRIVDFCNHTRVSLLLLYILTPVPASPLRAALKARGVRLSEAWQLYDGTHALFDTPNMRAEEIEAMFARVNKNVYSLYSILRRTLFPPHILMLMLNLFFRADVKNAVPSWVGTRVKKNVASQVAPMVAAVLTHPSIKKISRIIRYAEGRIIN